MGRCYRQPSANFVYLDIVRDALNQVCNLSYEIYFMGDLNIDWNSLRCPLKNKLQNVINTPTRSRQNKEGIKTSTSIDHIFTNAADLCSKGMSMSMVCSDHDLIAVVRKTKLPWRGPNVVFRRCYGTFDQHRRVIDAQKICWLDVLWELHADKELSEFMIYLCL